MFLEFKSIMNHIIKKYYIIYIYTFNFFLFQKTALGLDIPIID